MSYEQSKDQNFNEMTSSTTRLRVLFLTPWYPNRLDPVRGIFIQEHAKAVSLYDDVTVMHVKDRLRGKQTIREETDPKLTRNLPTFQIRASQPRIPVARTISRVRNVFRAVRDVYGNDPPDIIHSHIYYTGFYAVLLSREYGIPVVMTEQSSKFLRRLLTKPDLLRARFAMQRADIILPVSKALQKAIESYGIQANFHVVANVVEPYLFYPTKDPSPRSEKKRLIFVGELRTSHIKGMPYLLQALHLLNREDWYLDVVGGGPTRESMEQRAKELGLDDRITFHGQQPKNRVAELMREADFFVLSSLWETMGCVLIEAMATGLPVVATNVGGVPEVIDSPEVGILVPPANAEALAEGLARMLDSLHQYDQSIIVAKARQYSPEAIGQQIHSIYRQCIEANRSYTSGKR